jgi:hypothetical protein
MDAPNCDTIGCPARAGWVLTGEAPPLSEEYVCDAHLATACLLSPNLTNEYTHWNTFLARAMEQWTPNGQAAIASSNLCIAGTKPRVNLLAVFTHLAQSGSGS